MTHPKLTRAIETLEALSRLDVAQPYKAIHSALTDLRSLASELARPAEGAEEFAQRLRDLFWQYDNNNDLKWDEHILPIVREYSQAMRNAGLEAAAEAVGPLARNLATRDDLQRAILALKAKP